MSEANMTVCKRITISTLILTLVLSLYCITAFADSSPSLIISENEITLVKGKSTRIHTEVQNVENAKKTAFIWKSSDEAVCTVNNGNISARDGGTATVSCMATLEDGTTISADIKVIVTVPVTQLKMNTQNNIIIYPSETLKVDYTVLPENATDQSIEWSVADTDIATVSSDGTISVLKPGKTTVSGTANDGSGRKMQLSIYAPTFRIETVEGNVDNINGNDFSFHYYGTDDYWYENVSITEKGNVGYEYSYDTNGYNGVLHFIAYSTGNVTVTFADKKDFKSKVVFNLHCLDSAIAPPFGVLCSSASFKQDNYKTTWSVQLFNATTTEVAEVTYLIDYYDQFGDQRYVYYTDTGVMTDYAFTESVKLPSGKNTTVKNETYAFDKSTPMSKLRIAISHYRFKDGTSVTIPDNQLFWYETGKGYEVQTRPEITNIYTGPDKVIVEKSEQFMLGYNYISLYSYASKSYAHSKFPGLYITKVNPDSLAEKYGLLVGDVVYGIDEYLWTEYPQMADVGKARLYDGKTIIYHIIRNGEEKELEFQK